MPFCSNCGVQLANGAKFCQKCGLPVQNAKGNKTANRTEYAGKIFKCPNCGETIDSFEATCPACGYELRDAKVSSAIKEFALKLEAIEAKRGTERYRGLNLLDKISKTDEQKISLIRSFSIPNSKEDLLEFMILATSNINYRAYASSDSLSKIEQAIDDAWVTKIKKAYEKAKLLYEEDGNFLQEIESMYSNYEKNLNKSKKKGITKQALIIICAVGWVPIVLFGYWCIVNPIKEEYEVKRLEEITENVQEALNNKDYKYALLLADSIDYQRDNAAKEKKWDIERELWVDIVLEEAEKNGIILEYTPSEDIDNANKSEETKGDLPTGNDSEADKE